MPPGGDGKAVEPTAFMACLLYTSDAADERSSVDLGGRRIINKKTTTDLPGLMHDHYEQSSKKTADPHDEPQHI